MSVTDAGERITPPRVEAAHRIANAGVKLLEGKRLQNMQKAAATLKRAHATDLSKHNLSVSTERVGDTGYVVIQSATKPRAQRSSLDTVDILFGDDDGWGWDTMLNEDFMDERGLKGFIEDELGGGAF